VYTVFVAEPMTEPIFVVSTSPVEALVSVVKKFTAATFRPLWRHRSNDANVSARGKREAAGGAVKVMSGGSKTEKITVGEAPFCLKRR